MKPWNTYNAVEDFFERYLAGQVARPTFVIALPRVRGLRDVVSRHAQACDDPAVRADLVAVLLEA